MWETPSNNEKPANFLRPGRAVSCPSSAASLPCDLTLVTYSSAWDRRAHQTFPHKLEMEGFSVFRANRAVWGPKIKYFLLDLTIQNPARQKQRMKYPTPNIRTEKKKEMETSLSDNNQLWVCKLEAKEAFPHLHPSSTLPFRAQGIEH